MKGIVFTTDMIIGLSLAIVLLFLIPLRIETGHTEESFQELLYQSNDLVNLLSTMKASSFSSTPTISGLVSSNAILPEDLNKTILDLIGSFWYSGNESIASNITKDVLGNLTTKCFSLKTQNQLIYSSCNYVSDALGVSQRIASGYEIGKPVSGYVSRAFLTNIISKKTASYAYFGGYTGQGNITQNITISPFDMITEAYIELDAGTDFTLYINGNYAGFYPKGLAGGGYMRADKWDLTSGNFSFFQAGENTLQVNFTNRSYIGGGYFKVTYNTTELASTESIDYKKVYLPGIDGVINLYDSFYIPGSLSTMNVFLHYKSDLFIHMEVGNTSFFVNTVANPSSFTFSNSTLAANLDYAGLGQRTIPIRIGHYALNKTNETGYVSDVFLTTSRVPPMSTVDIPNGTANISRMDAAIAVDKIFINTILNNTGNRIGLISYASDIPNSCPSGICWTNELTDGNLTLINNVSGYTPASGVAQRYLCGAINEAASKLTSPLRKKYILVMSDGSAEKKTGGGCPNSDANLCPQANYTPGNLTDEERAAVNEAYAAYLKNITVYSVGFGESANTNLLRQIAACGGGEWAASNNYTGLVDIYTTFGGLMSNQSIIFKYQEVVSSDFNSTLYPDSYIEFNYTPAIIPYEYGEISLTRETDRFKTFSGDAIDIPYKEGWFNVSEKVKVTDARVTSYSSEFWTDRMYVKNASSDWNTAYWLGDYGNYTALGDPFIVEIPVSYLGFGNNSVRIGTGFGPDNATGGSPDDRIIYTIRLKGSIGYGDVFNTSGLADADAKQRLIAIISDYVDINVDDIQIETQSVSGIKWLWGPSMFKVLLWERE